MNSTDDHTIELCVLGVPVSVMLSYNHNQLNSPLQLVHSSNFLHLSFVEYSRQVHLRDRCYLSSSSYRCKSNRNDGLIKPSFDPTLCICNLVSEFSTISSQQTIQSSLSFRQSKREVFSPSFAFSLCASSSYLNHQSSFGPCFLPICLISYLPVYISSYLSMWLFLSM